MHRRSAILGALVLGSAALFAASFSTAQEAQWTSLLDPTTLDNFDRTGDANWRLADGIAEADMGFGYLVTKETYGDFVLHAEFWVNDEANSGIFIRCEDPADPNPRTCYEVNIFDQRPDPTFGTGGIPGHAPVAGVPKTGGKWNTYDIIAQGDHIVLVLNGLRTVDIHDNTHASGHIGLQFGAGIVRFRKAEIRPL
jgi:hypothetical protein